MTDPTLSFSKNSYAVFDGTSVRDLLISRLNSSGVFTDQNYIGSNLSALLDVIGYTVGSLLFYLNKTSSESLFSDAQIYENVNRIVKILNYNPVGRLGQTLPFSTTVSSELAPGNYIIPRYSSLTIGTTRFSINQDIVFLKKTNTEEPLSELDNKYLLYQGQFIQRPMYSAVGSDNEIVYLSLSDSTLVDHFNIFAYVKEADDSKWVQWSRVEELFLHSSNDKVFSVRFNENKHYEIKFGDNINGKKLNQNDKVIIFYLKTSANSTSIAAGSLNESASMSPFTSESFLQVLSDTQLSFGSYLEGSRLSNLKFFNEHPSTVFSQEESIEKIKLHAPKHFRAQYRLNTSSDYESFIFTNFGNLIADCKVINNQEFLEGHIKYLYDIGLKQPQLENSILLNQIKFANSCNFNNVYVYTIPSNENLQYLPISLKELIFNRLKDPKTITSQTVTMDSVFMYLDFGIAMGPGRLPQVEDKNQTKLKVYKSRDSRRPLSSIKAEVIQVITNFFNRKVNKLGELINIYQLTTNITSIEGVSNVITYREDLDVSVTGVSLLIWNSVYPLADTSISRHTLQLQYFQYPIFNDIPGLSNRIEVLESVDNTLGVSF
jgi:hypothetical protein